MKLLCISLGCDKNLVDTEKMMGLLYQDGWEFTDNETEADAVLINTCCFIGDAKEESVNTILEMAELKKEGRIKALLVAGCMAERYKQEVLEEIPEVDVILGTASGHEILTALKETLEGKGPVSCFRDLSSLPKTTAGRILTTGGS